MYVDHLGLDEDVSNMIIKVVTLFDQVYVKSENERLEKTSKAKFQKPASTKRKR